jgi:hypothetical protein
MRNGSILVVAMMFVACLALPKAGATVVFDDGLTHYIGQFHPIYLIDEPAEVRNSPSNEATTVNFVSGSLVKPGPLQVFDDSYVSMRGGPSSAEVHGSVMGHDSSHIHVLSGGYIFYGALFAFDNSEVSVAGYIANYLEASGNSSITLSPDYIGYAWSRGYAHMTMSGGTVGQNLIATENSSIHVYGGSIWSNLYARDGSEVTISGGSINGDIFAGNSSGSHNSTVTIEGSDFYINGSPVTYGTYTAFDYASGHIAGTIGAGSLDNTFYIYDDASIVLVPEPTTLLLLGLGALALFRRKR